MMEIYNWKYYLRKSLISHGRWFCLFVPMTRKEIEALAHIRNKICQKALLLLSPWLKGDFRGQGISFFSVWLLKLLYQYLDYCSLRIIWQYKSYVCFSSFHLCFSLLTSGHEREKPSLSYRICQLLS